LVARTEYLAMGGRERFPSRGEVSSTSRDFKEPASAGGRRGNPLRGGKRRKGGKTFNSHAAQPVLSSNTPKENDESLLPLGRKVLEKEHRA